MNGLLIFIFGMFMFMASECLFQYTIGSRIDEVKSSVSVLQSHEEMLAKAIQNCQYEIDILTENQTKYRK